MKALLFLLVMVALSLGTVAAVAIFAPTLVFWIYLPFGLWFLYRSWGGKEH